jgi:predicted  nucleic acid-binding Zn-ribbon protein
MARTPESFMIYKEELRKAEVEKKKLKEEYENKLSELKLELSVLKERIYSQEDMLKRVVDYASKLEESLDQLNSKVDVDILKNSNGYH